MTLPRAILQVFYGPAAFQKIVLEPGQRRSVGRSPRADVVLAGDKSLAGQHFEIVWDGRAAQVRDLDSPSGIELGGQPAWRGKLRHRGWMTAGSSTFRLFVEACTPPAEPLANGPALDAALAELGPAHAAGQLFAVLDAARSERVLELLEESVDEHASLYEGIQGRVLDDAAPYLVHFQPGSGLLHRLLGESLEKAWGVYLASELRRKLVRRHLRRFLMVEAEPSRERRYFRFYDPRVLATFAEFATTRQASDLTAGLDALWYEDRAGVLHRFGSRASAG